MKRIGGLTLLFAILCFVGCAKSDKQKAKSLLDEARVAIDEARYDQAAELLDSIHTTYTDLLAERKKALELQKELNFLRMELRIDSIELRLGKIDSLIVEQQNALYAAPSGSEYGTEASFRSALRTAQFIAANPLQLKTDTLGFLTLQELYAGGTKLNHDSFTLTAGNEQVLIEPITHDQGLNYRFQSAGINYESLTLSPKESRRVAFWIDSIAGEQVDHFILQRQLNGRRVGSSQSVKVAKLSSFIQTYCLAELYAEKFALQKEQLRKKELLLNKKEAILNKQQMEDK